MSVLKKLASETAVYGLSSILGRLIYYLLVIVHTGVFNPNELAITVTLFSWAAVLQIVYTFGMETTFFRYAKAENKDIVYNQLFTAVLVVTLSFTLIFVAFPRFFADIIGYPVSKFPEASKYIIWMAFIIGIDAAVAIPFARLRQEKQGKRFATIKFLNILINVLLNLLFLWVFKDVYEGKYWTNLQPLVSKIYHPGKAVGLIFLANLIANIAMILMMRTFFFNLKPSFNQESFKKYWIYAFPILIVGLAGTLNGLTDRFVLESFLPKGYYANRTSKEALGIYGNCLKLAIFMNLAVQAFKYAADPFFFSKSEDKNATKTFALVMKWFIIVCVVIWIGVSINLDLFGKIFLKKEIYREGLAIVPVLLLANLFLGIYYNLSFWYKITDKTQYGTYLTIMGATVTIIANIVLIPKMGYLGCAWAFLISTAAMMIACYFLGEKHYPVPYDIKSALGYLAAGTILILTFNKINFSNYWLNIFIQNFVIILFLAGIYILEMKVLKRKNKLLRVKNG